LTGICSCVGGGSDRAIHEEISTPPCVSLDMAGLPEVVAGAMAECNWKYRDGRPFIIKMPIVPVFWAIHLPSCWNSVYH
jgi:hypothetical protein